MAKKKIKEDSAMVVESRIKKFVKGEGLNTASDLATEADVKLRLLLKEGCDRAKANSRKTLTAKDL